MTGVLVKIAMVGDWGNERKKLERQKIKISKYPI